MRRIWTWDMTPFVASYLILLSVIMTLVFAGIIVMTSEQQESSVTTSEQQDSSTVIAEQQESSVTTSEQQDPQVVKQYPQATTDSLASCIDLNTNTIVLTEESSDEFCNAIVAIFATIRDLYAEYSVDENIAKWEALFALYKKNLFSVVQPKYTAQWEALRKREQERRALRGPSDNYNHNASDRRWSMIKHEYDTERRALYAEYSAELNVYKYNIRRYCIGAQALLDDLDALMTHQGFEYDEQWTLPITLLPDTLRVGCSYFVQTWQWSTQPTKD